MPSVYKVQTVTLDKLDKGFLVSFRGRGNKDYDPSSMSEEQHAYSDLDAAFEAIREKFK